MQIALPLIVPAVLALWSPAAPPPGGFGVPMFIESCSLGCSNGAGGAQVSCTIFDVHQNEDIRVRFSNDVDLVSVTAATFRIVNLMNGTTPPGSFFLDPRDPRTIVFRPALSFDMAGNPFFGFEAGDSYQIEIPGEALDGPPFVQSTGGANNQSRLLCTVQASLGVLPPVDFYCSTSPNSVGAGARMGFTGTTSIAANDLVLEVDGCPPLQLGRFFFGRDPAQVPFGNGTQCVGGSITRLHPPVATDGSGTASRAFDASSLAPGSTWRFQFLYRDVAAGGSGFNLSNGMEAIFLP